MPKICQHKSDNNDYYTATLYMIPHSPQGNWFCLFPKVLLSRENTLSEAAEEGCTSSAFLAAPAQCGRIVSLAFYYSQNVCNVHTISSGKVSWKSSVFRNLESFKKGIALKVSNLKLLVEVLQVRKIS